MRSSLRVAQAPVTLLIVSAFAIGCGGAGKSTTVVNEQPPDSQTSFAPGLQGQQARGQDAEAKSNVRNMVSQVEACATDYSGDYIHCANLRNTGLATGSAPGQVEVTAAPGTYTVTGHSQSGNTFEVSKDASGAMRRTCEVRAAPGGCLGGTW